MFVWNASVAMRTKRAARESRDHIRSVGEQHKRMAWESEAMAIIVDDDAGQAPKP